jgi:hypothetical protein
MSKRKARKDDPGKPQSRRERDRALQVEQQRLRQSGVPGPLVNEYEKVVKDARRQHPTLLGIFECDDGVYFDFDDNARLAHFDLGHLRMIYARVTDAIDIDSDLSSKDGVVNKHRPRPEEPFVGGATSLVTDGQRRFIVVFMRRATGLKSGSPEHDAILKLSALLHELGHVTDIQGEINYHFGEAECTIDLTKAEVFAHHFACREMVKGRYRMSLGYYLDGLERMAESPQEYVRLAALEVIGSPEYRGYKAEVSPSYGSDPR